MTDVTKVQSLFLVAQMPLRLFIVHGLPSNVEPDSCRVVSNWNDNERAVCIFSLDERKAA